MVQPCKHFKFAMSPSIKRLSGAIVGLAIAATLIWTLGVALDFSGRDVVVFIRHHFLSLAILAVLSISLQVWLSALKWRFLLERQGQSGAPLPQMSTLCVYLSAATIGSQILPAAIAVPAVRGLAGRFKLGQSLTGGLTMTVYDQMFDVGVLVLTAMICATVIFLGGSIAQAVAGAMAVLALAMILPTSIFAILRPIQGLSRLIARVQPLDRRFRAGLEAAHRGGIDAPATTALLLRLSIVRYLAIGLRSVVTVLIAVPALDLVEAAWGHAVVQSASLLALTPGNLGVMEWGWAGVELLLSVPAGGLVMAILALRIVTLPATCIALGCFWVISQTERR